MHLTFTLVIVYVHVFYFIFIYYTHIEIFKTKGRFKEATNVFILEKDYDLN